MPIITTYPFKKAPLDKKDEIVLSDALSSDPNFKTKTTDLDQLMKYVQSNITTIEPISLGTGNSIQLTGISGFGTAGQVLAVNQAEDALEYIDGGGGGGSISVKDANTTVDPTKILNFTGKIFTVTADATDATQADVAGSYNTLVADSTLTVEDVGSIQAGTAASTLKGNDIVDLLDKIFFPTVPPTYLQPTLAITGSALSNIEIGTTITPTLSMTFVKKDSGGFVAPMVLERNSVGLTPINETTNPSADIPDQFPGVPNTNNPQATTTASYSDSYLVTAATNVTSTSILYKATADYSQGNVLNDSTGNPSGSALPAGDKVATKTYTAFYPWYYYYSPNPITASDMVTAIANGSATKNIADSQGTINIPFNITAQFVAVAYPESSTEKTKFFVTNLNQGPITAVFDPVTVNQVSEQGGLWNNIDYNIHVSFGPQTSTITPLQLRNN